jgi:hypothetical protein
MSDEWKARHTALLCWRWLYALVAAVCWVVSGVAAYQVTGTDTDLGAWFRAVSIVTFLGALASTIAAVSLFASWLTTDE